MKGERVKMKGLLLILAVFMLLTGTWASADFALFGSIDVGGEAISDGSKQDVNTSGALAVEFYKPFRKIFQLGGGLQYQFPRGYSEGSGQFSFIPLYGSIRLVVPLVAVKPYGVGRIGYGFLTGNDEFRSGGDPSGGLYYGLGAGVVLLKILLIEGSYNVNAGSVGSTDFDYQKFSVSAGVNLTIGK
jgi:hypothetical protein